MTSPVISIPPNSTLKKATNLMTRYDINVLLVMDRKQELKGYVTRQIVEKAESEKNSREDNHKPVLLSNR